MDRWRLGRLDGQSKVTRLPIEPMMNNKINMMWLRLVFLLLAAFGLVGCASGGRAEVERDEARREIARLEQIVERQDLDLSQLRADANLCREALRKPEIDSVRECRAELRGCQATSIQAEEKARVQGKLSVWQGLSVEAYPEESGIFFKDYYLTFVVKANNRVLFRYKVETEAKDNGFQKAFSALADAATFASLFN